MSFSTSKPIPNLTENGGVTDLAEKYIPSHSHSTTDAYPRSSGWSRYPSLDVNMRSRLVGDDMDDAVTKQSLSSTSNSNTGASTDQNDQNARTVRCTCSAADVQQALRHSEGRRQLLLEKLKDTQDTIRVQVQKTNELGTALVEKDSKIEQLQLSEQDYRRKLRNAENDLMNCREKLLEQKRQFDEDQLRSDKLQSEVNLLRSANTMLQQEYQQKKDQLNRTNVEMTALKLERDKMLKLTDKLASELNAASGADVVSQAKNEQLENQARVTQRGVDLIKKEHYRLLNQNTHLQKQLAQVNSQLESVQAENGTLTASFHCSKMEKDTLVRKITELQEINADLKTTLAKTTEDKKWYFQEKLELHQKLHSATLAQEALLKERLTLGTHIDELTDELARAKSVAGSTDDEKRRLVGELSAAKKVSDALSVEMTTMRSRLDQQQNHVRSIEQVRDETLQQCHVYEQEISRLENLLDMGSRSRKQSEEDAERNSKQLATEIQTWKANCEQLQLQLKDKQVAVDDQRGTIQQLQLQKTKLEHKMENLVDDHSEEMEKHVTQIRRLEAEKEEVLAANKNMAAQVQSVQKTVEVFQLIHQEDARLMTEIKKEKDAMELRIRSRQDHTRSLPEVSELHARVADLEKELQSSKETLQKQEALIFVLKQKPSTSESVNGFLGEGTDNDNDNDESHSLSSVVLTDVEKKCRGTSPAEMKRETEMLQRKNRDLQETVESLTKELDAMRYQHENAIEEMRKVDREQHERTVEKIRRELNARDRQIESLEEQLAKYNDNSLRRVKRECSRVELLSAHNRLLQSQLDEMQTVRREVELGQLPDWKHAAPDQGQPTVGTADHQPCDIVAQKTSRQNGEIGKSFAEAANSIPYDCSPERMPSENRYVSTETMHRLNDVVSGNGSFCHERQQVGKRTLSLDVSSEVTNSLGFVKHDRTEFERDSSSVGNSGSDDSNEHVLLSSSRTVTSKSDAETQPSASSRRQSATNCHVVDSSSTTMWSAAILPTASEPGGCREHVHGNLNSAAGAAIISNVQAASANDGSLSSPQESQTKCNSSSTKCVEELAHVATAASDAMCELNVDDLQSSDGSSGLERYDADTIASTREYGVKFSVSSKGSDSSDAAFPQGPRGCSRDGQKTDKQHDQSSSVSVASGGGCRTPTIGISGEVLHSPSSSNSRIDGRSSPSPSCAAGVEESPRAVSEDRRGGSGLPFYAALYSQQLEPRIANDEDYSVGTDDEQEETEDNTYYTCLYTTCNLASELAAAELQLKKLGGAGSRRCSRVSAAEADSRRGSRISAVDLSSRRSSGISMAGDEVQSVGVGDRDI